jgi:hypothetical protein
MALSFPFHKFMFRKVIGGIPYGEFTNSFVLKISVFL